MVTICDSYSTVSIWDKKLVPELFDGIRLSEKVSGNYKPETTVEGEHMIDGRVTPLLFHGELEVAKTKTCSVCNMTFQSREDQVLHFKQDWHCENLKRRDEGLPPLIQETPEKSNRRTGSLAVAAEDSVDQNETESDGLSSASDSEVESASTLASNSIRHAKMYFENKNGDMLSVYKCMVLKKKDVPLSEAEVIKRLKLLPSFTTWAVFLLGGGHFAGGIFKENEVVAQKTFHRYVTRAKQGSVQSIHDHQRKHAKSAGAQLRRHNELALTEEIQKLCETWTELLEGCTQIFYRATGNNKRVLFGGKKPLFQKNDARLCSIPFPTKQATHQEVVRAYSKLSAIECFGSASKWENKVPQLPATPASPRKPIVNKQKLSSANTCNGQTKSRNQTEDRPKSDSKQADERVQQLLELSASKTRQETPQRSRESSIDSNNENLILSMQEELCSTSGLQQFEVVFEEKTVSVAAAAKVTAGSEKPLSPHYDKEEQTLRNALYTACRVDDIESLQRLLSPLRAGHTGTQTSPKPDVLVKMLNSAIGINGSTLLHISAQRGYKALIWLLLESGADPSIGDKKGQPAYTGSINKEIRNTFRRFMAAFPEKYDYVKAQIPSPLSEEAEKAKSIKMQQRRQQKKQKTKALKLEQDEKAKFLSSSEAEKVISSTGKGGSRCFFCGDTLANKVPFSYDAFKFCSLRCLQQHRRR